MSNKIVFDIETKNTFEDVGGQEHIEKLEASVVGVYSYATDTYRAFEEREFPELGELFQRASLLIGFYSKKFDIPVMEKYFPFKIATIPHFDILEEIEKRLGRRIGLGHLAEANLGMGKTAHGLEAIEFWKHGELQKLKEYCLQDVRITKELYERIKSPGFLWIPDRNIATMTKLEFNYAEPEPPQAKLL
ncbi:MAG: ribonuclease H-like domain-containing protein [Patescibacteria group bacterium]